MKFGAALGLMALVAVLRQRSVKLIRGVSDL